ncbi:single-stranded-DNA-specific exonuclease RecJ [Pelomonas aquatica]|uniref:Single-stranded-DNA-specific exonuclease RecJ n=1 Tax=Pelomonas aquatica TaxID=431058 RepID=A0A9X4LG80_9BURK|nr:single-stranded-DNA-specific exonuclease RecJ [Pelomonas aquatica]MCY4755608.1 single-stranded-DNA-specific exonuclease RecJ [Pelomonas aquatica]MDG0862179.1 single-stranded-DNA-specific exonuclease RecJ [Pelomonas aquatica]
MSSPQLIEREVPPRTAWALEQAGVAPLLARLLAARGVREAAELDESLAQLLPPTELKGLRDAARLLADALQNGERLVIVADYDCDGATACAVMLRGLRQLGARPGQLGYVVPDRAVHGYGLTPTIVDLALEQNPALLVTVDNGIASLAGVAHARAQGLKVLVTDHHLPAIVDGSVVVPEAEAIVNPNQPGCTFASKSLAGVGVAFYVLLGLRAELRSRGALPSPEPRLDGLLDLVALGTVADVVKLDANNRRLVAQGLRRMRSGRAQPGVMALFSAAKRDASKAQGFDLGFALGPRINAAGRLADMTLGIETLTTDDPERALALATQLDTINRERREIESGMREMAEARLDALVQALEGELPPAVALFDADFHEGVVGIVASRIKDRVHRPTFVFAHGADGQLKGSGRSIPGFHLRDALDLVAKREPELLAKFGGHAMAAGATLAGGDTGDVQRFALAFARVAEEWLNEQDLTRTLRHDGALPPDAATPETARLLDAQVWGQGFEPPLFCDRFELVSQRLVGEKHLKLRLRQAGRLIDAIWFNHVDMLPERVTLAYRLSLDEWQGQQRVQYVIEACSA